MTVISSTEARQNFGAFLDKGSREIVVVKRQNREIGAFVPMSELKKLRELQNRELLDAAHKLSEEAKAKGLTQERLQEILKELSPSSS